MDRVLEELGLFSEQAIDDPKNANLDQPTSPKDNLHNFVKHFDEKYKELKIPRLTERLVRYSNGPEEKGQYPSATTLGGTPVKSHEEGLASEPYIAGLQYMISTGRLPNSPLKARQQSSKVTLAGVRT